MGKPSDTELATHEEILRKAMIDLLAPDKCTQAKAIKIVEKKINRIIRERNRTDLNIESEDIVQDSLIAIVGSAKCYNPEYPAGGWIYTVASRIMWSALKRSSSKGGSRRARGYSLDAEQTEDGAMLRDIVPDDNALSPLLNTSDSDDRHLLLATIDELCSPFEAEAVEATYFDGLSYEDAAERLQCSVKSIDNAIQRVVRHLQELAVRSETSTLEGLLAVACSHRWKALPRIRKSAEQVRQHKRSNQEAINAKRLAAQREKAEREAREREEKRLERLAAKEAAKSESLKRAAYRAKKRAEQRAKPLPKPVEPTPEQFVYVPDEPKPKRPPPKIKLPKSNQPRLHYEASEIASKSYLVIQRRLGGEVKVLFDTDVLHRATPHSWCCSWRAAEKRFEIHTRINVRFARHIYDIHADMLITYRDGDGLNCTRENIEIITRAENLNRVSYRNQTVDR